MKQTKHVVVALISLHMQAGMTQSGYHTVLDKKRHFDWLGREVFTGPVNGSQTKKFIQLAICRDSLDIVCLAGSIGKDRSPVRNIQPPVERMSD